MKKLLLTAALSLALAACASDPADAEYDKLSAEAAAEIALAKKSGFLWTNTEGFVKKAEKAKSDGDMKAAIKNLKKAIREAQLAQAQAKHEANPSVPF